MPHAIALSPASPFGHGGYVSATYKPARLFYVPQRLRMFPFSISLPILNHICIEVPDSYVGRSPVSPRWGSHASCMQSGLPFLYSCRFCRQRFFQNATATIFCYYYTCYCKRQDAIVWRALCMLNRASTRPRH